MRQVGGLRKQPPRSEQQGDTHVAETGVSPEKEEAKVKEVKIRLSEATFPGRGFLDIVRANDSKKVYEIYGNMNIPFLVKQGRQLAELLDVPFVDEKGKPVEESTASVSPLDRVGRKRA